MYPLIRVNNLLIGCKNGIGLLGGLWVASVDRFHIFRIAVVLFLIVLLFVFGLSRYLLGCL